MSKRQIDLSFLEEQPNVTVNLSFVDEDPLEREKKRNQPMLDYQAAKYPSAQELGRPVEGPRPWKDVLHPRALVTTFKDLVSPLELLKRNENQPGWLDAFGLGGRAVYNLAGAMGSAREHSETEAGRAWAEGDYLAGGTRALLNMVPVIGPMVANMAEEGGKDPATLTGHALAAATGPKVYKAAAQPAKTARAVASAPRAVKNMAIDATAAMKGVQPARQVFAALRPRNFIRNADKNIEGAMPWVNRGAEITGKPTTDIFSFGDNLNAAIKDAMRKRKAVDASNPIEIEGKPIADAIVRSVPKLERITNPDHFRAIRDWANETWNRKFAADEIVDMLEDMNASSSVQGYYQKLPGQQIALNHRLNSSMANAQAQAARELLIDNFDKFSGTGTARGQLNRALRDMITTKDLFDRRYNVELRQAAQNLPQQVSKLMAAGRFGKAAKELASGNVGMAGLEALTGLSEIALANVFREMNSTSGQIASAFRRFKDAPGPITINPVTRRSLGPAQSTVQPQTTGSYAPGGRASSWQRPGSMSLAQGLREDPAVFMETGVGEMTPRMRDLLNQPTSANTMALTSRRPYQPPADPDFIDVPFTIKPKFEMPASPIENEILAQQHQRLLPAGAERITPMPESSLRNLLNLEQAESIIVRDPKTGRFRKVFTSQSKKNSERGSVTIGGDDPQALRNLSEPGKKLVKVGAVVNPKDVKPRKGMFHSLVVDDSGAMIDLGDFTHDVAMERAGILQGLDSPEGIASLSDALRENKFVRVQFLPKDISLEIHAAPSQRAIAQIRKLFEANPKAKVSYDIVAGDASQLKNNATAADFFKALDSAFSTGKTNNQLIRERLDAGLTSRMSGSDRLFGEGPAFPDSDFTIRDLLNAQNALNKKRK